VNLDLIVSRLRKAHAKHSLRELGKFCDVNHETIRKLILSNKEPSMTSTVYKKLDEGLLSNGF